MSLDMYARNRNDTQIGQQLERMAPLLDYLSPMLYPSGFQYGIPDCRNPVAHPYEIVFCSLGKARERTASLPSIRFVSWLQAFKDYAFDRKHFNAKEIRAQIEAAEEAGSDGWMLWNPHNLYSQEGLRNKSADSPYSSLLLKSARLDWNNPLREISVGWLALPSASTLECGWSVPGGKVLKSQKGVSFNCG